MKRLRKLLADITFLEAHERTNRFLNVTVTAADTNEPPRMLNFMTAPNVLVWSAVACSSAFPGLFPAQELLARDRDGRFVKYACPFPLFGHIKDHLFCITSCHAGLSHHNPGTSVRRSSEQCIL